jgi:hypothetical protein
MLLNLTIMVQSPYFYTFLVFCYLNVMVFLLITFMHVKID